MGYKDGERRARPVPRRDVKHLHAVVVQGALSAPDYDDLVTDHSRGPCTTRRWQVSLHLGMGPGNKKGNGPFIGLPNLGMACVSHPARTDIETPPRNTLYRRIHQISTPRCPRGGPCARESRA